MTPNTTTIPTSSLAQTQQEQQEQHDQPPQQNSQGLPSLSFCRIPALVEKFQEQIYRLEALERKVDARAVQTRRRITNLLDSQYYNNSNKNRKSSSTSCSGSHATVHRQSHLRIFVTHNYDVLSGTASGRKEENEEGNNIKEQHQQQPKDSISASTSTNTCTTSTSHPDRHHSHYKLLIEGKLLVGHLDHESAVAYDAKTGYTPPVDDLDRSKGEQEEVPEVVPIHCTHFFTKVVVHLEPLYYDPMMMSQQQQQQQTKKQPKQKSPQPTTSKKSSRRGGGGGAATGTTATSTTPSSSSSNTPNASSAENNDAAAAAPTVAVEVDPATLVRGPSTTLTWTRDMSTDANGWEISYQVPEPPPPIAASASYASADYASHHLVPHSVVAKIQLYNSTTTTSTNTSATASAAPVSSSLSQQQQSELLLQQDLYQPNDKHNPAILKLFPIHRPEERPTPSRSSSTTAATANNNHNNTLTPPPPSSVSPVVATENSIYIPQGLTLQEIYMAFFAYIRDRQLYDDDDDKSVVVCDETLQSVFGGRERFPFHQLHQLIASCNLFTKLVSSNTQDEQQQQQHPVVDIVYILKPETAVNTNAHVAPEKDIHTLLQLDTDVAVPDLFAFRCRELLRRIKRRELEYTSSRTKARYLLMARRAKNEEAVKYWLDQAVGGHAIGPHDQKMQPILAALAKSTPPQTEARMAAHYDMRMGYLLERIQERKQAALLAWRIVDACYCGGVDGVAGATSRRSTAADNDTITPTNDNGNNNTIHGNEANHNKPSGTRKRARSSDD